MFTFKKYDNQMVSLQFFFIFLKHNWHKLMRKADMVLEHMVQDHKSRPKSQKKKKKKHGTLHTLMVIARLKHFVNRSRVIVTMKS